MTLAWARSSAALRAAITSARVPALMFASCASATILAASPCSFFAIVSGLSMRTRTAPAATSWPSFTGISATRPSTRAAMSSCVASTTPWTNSGDGHIRYQIDRAEMATATTPTMMDRTRLGRDALFFDTSGDCVRLASVRMAGFGVSAPAEVRTLYPYVFDSRKFLISASNRRGRLRLCTNDLQQGFAASGMGLQGSVSPAPAPAPALVLHVSLHYH